MSAETCTKKKHVFVFSLDSTIVDLVRGFDCACGKTAAHLTDLGIVEPQPTPGVGTSEGETQ